MRLAVLAALLLPTAFAQTGISNTTQYLTEVLGALTAAGLTSLVQVAGSIANTTEGQILLGDLARGNRTVFAPTNAAFANVSSDVSSNTTLLTEILSYHISRSAQYTVNGTAVAPNHTIIYTALHGANNRSIPLVVARNSSSATSFQIMQAESNVTAMGPASAVNLNIYTIDQVLMLPPNISTAITELAPSLGTLAEGADLLEPLMEASALTIFAPSDSAIAAIASQVSSLNSTVVGGILANHIINGTAVYSTELMNSNYTSAGGERFMFASNSSGVYVMSGNSTAKVIRSDVIIENGVVHVIDGVLLNTMTNSGAAQSAYTSNTAAQATETGPTGVISNTAQTSTAATASSSSTKSAAGRSALFSSSAAVGLAVGAIGAVIGGGLVLA